MLQSSPALEPASGATRPRPCLDMILLGTGTVGGRLLEILDRHLPALREQGIDLNLCGVAQADAMVLEERGLRPGAWRDKLRAAGTPMDLDALLAWIRRERLARPALVDCTTSPELAARYADILGMGIHVVAANKKANSSSQAFYEAMREAARRSGARFLYETNVGAGLPVIDTIGHLRRGGDRVLEAEGILSGSLSCILGLLSEGVPFSQAVLEAMERGFTEPDPRDDLSGMDVARKLLILAREMGYRLELEDVVVEGLLPDGFGQGLDTAAFLERMPELDPLFEERGRTLAREGKVLRYVGKAGPEGCRVGLAALEPAHPLAAVNGGENAIALLTAFYQPRPLVVRGYGAGASVTASGVLADVLRLVPGA